MMITMTTTLTMTIIMLEFLKTSSFVYVGGELWGEQATHLYVQYICQASLHSLPRDTFSVISFRMAVDL